MDKDIKQSTLAEAERHLLARDRMHVAVPSTLRWRVAASSGFSGWAARCVVCGHGLIQ